MTDYPDLYADLTAYTGRDERLVRARCQTAIVELAWLWERYQHNPTAYYSETDLYLFDLTEYQAALRRGGMHTDFQAEIEAHGWRTGLDFGGGIGEWAMLAASAGVDMAYHDLYPGQTWDYAAWRFQRHGSPVRMIERDPLAQRYDFIVIMDVLEHLPDPDALLAQLARRTEWIFANPDQLRYDWPQPQHISHYDLHPNWVQRGVYLWQRK